MLESLDTRYDHKTTEPELYKLWEQSGHFNPDTPRINADRNADKRRKNIRVHQRRNQRTSASFSVVLPPPNVTGTLHLGHAFEHTIQDIMVRFKRMRGYRTLWVPGTDHAAIATQAKVEKDLLKTEGKSRHDLGREEFLKRVTTFALASHDTIVNQVRRLGASLDWSREAYTLDAARETAVHTGFKRMHELGLIYRGNRIVNWDPKMQTTVSDDEIEWVEEKAPFYYLKYGPFTIGTARPETKFGDKYVVLHPKDPRYVDYRSGQTLEVDWMNGTITATVVKDEAIDMSFGTGVMTITPWHDATDFDIAERHGLTKEQIIDERGKLLAVAGEFADMHIAKARPLIVEKLKTLGLVERIDESYIHRIATNSRGGGIIEPQIKPQWFVDVNKKFKVRGSRLKGIGNGKKVTLKEMMRQTVKSGQIKITPERFKKIYFHWIENLRDWCISRQLWFGHRIPAWFCIGRVKIPEPKKKMGFHERVVPQVFVGKTKTYRLNDHHFMKGDLVAFENSQTGKVFGYGVIENIERIPIGSIDLKDKAHSATYDSAEELVAAFKRHYPPDREINKKTVAIIYTYRFTAKSENSEYHDCGEVRINPAIKSRWFFVRHGETDWNKANISMGHADRSLTDDGREQAKRVAEALKDKHIGLIISSDLRRCRETAEIIQRATKAELIFDPNLRERHLGITQGMDKGERNRIYSDLLYGYDTRLPGGESFKDLESRVFAAFKKHRKSHNAKNVVIVTHGGTIRMLIKQFKNWTHEEMLGREAKIGELVELAITEKPCATCRGDLLEQDPDTFDTWFSAGMWTFSTLGWPQLAKTAKRGAPGSKNDLANYHPTSFMAPGYEILFLWVARMILMSGCLLNDIPFRTVYLHGIVRDAKGQKFSKSLGNGIDPLLLADTYGADAIRMALVMGAAPGNDVKFDEERVRGYRNFTTKVWNISRFVLLNKPPRIDADAERGLTRIKLTTDDKKDIAEVKKIKTRVARHIEKYEFHLAADLVYHYIWHTFADIIIEKAKLRLQGSDTAEKQVAYDTLETILIESLTMLHPFMPFVSEAIYQKFRPGELLMVKKW